ncbi:DUF969 domain-containing protein [Aeromonas hydrophila]|uniref:DUF969 domain-containing protein n=1 Tax=Aeromonas hydrophila TaxID=644 RepID=UPI003986E7AC
MESSMNYWPLLGVAVVIAGFALRFNALLVVMLAGIVTGLAAQMQPEALLAAIGSGFIKTLNLPLILLLPLPVVGLLERHGLKERAQGWIAGIHMATAGRLLLVYLLVRELTAALGLTSLGGHPQMVRPLLAPMAEGAAEHRHPNLTMRARQRVRAMSAATDNVGLFFGEDVFVAFGAIMLMHTFLRENGVEVEPLHIALWGIPTAIAAFIIHGIRLYRLDGWLVREAHKQFMAEEEETQSKAAEGGR